jgi:hypothetical protein
VQILWWLVPAFLVTCAAMAVAGWAGRERRESDRRSEAAQERFAQAIQREHPTAHVSRPRPVRDRSTGIAVRPSRSGSVDDRRSA